jgi:cytosine/adenosine deaminase-related metal-dependent hydrolase
MNLKDLTIAGTDGLMDILIENERIIAISDPAKSPHGSSTRPTGLSLSFNGAIVFPGLINSHDHLDFNLFPPLANRIYRNYSEWGPDIHKHNRKEIDAVLKIPQALRTQWGIYKNLLNGVTTVVNHGERLVTDLFSLDPGYGDESIHGDELINVFQDCHCLHSVGFEKNWKWKLNRPFTGTTPFVLHVGEGTDAAAGQEIDRLIRWNLFSKPLIGIHGVAMREDQAKGFRALVWCPVTNYFLLGRTAPVDRLKNHLPILFGTDSTLTAGWNIWEHLRLARKEGQLTDHELLDSVTIAAAKVWKLPYTGSVSAGQYADLVIARSGNGQMSGGIYKNMDAFFALDPEDILLVLHRGRVRLFDACLYDALFAAGFAIENFHSIAVGNNHKYIQGDLPGLVKKVREYYPAVLFPFTID